MPTSWNRADVNVLRAHLQEALAERAASADAADWGYSDYEVEALRAELNERETAPTPQPHDAARIDTVGTLEARDPDLDRIRILIARCFSPAARSSRNTTAEVDAMASHGRHVKPSTHRFARLQRLL